MAGCGTFRGGEESREIAAALRVSVRSVEYWRRQWCEDGAARVASKGSPGRPKLSDAQIARLEGELERGLLAHGWEDQGRTLARVKTLIGRLFHVSYIVEGTWVLLKRHGWSWQQPARRAVERDDTAVELSVLRRTAQLQPGQGLAGSRSQSVITNLYGPTELTISCSDYTVPGDPREWPPHTQWNGPDRRSLSGTRVHHPRRPRRADRQRRAVRPRPTALRRLPGPRNECRLLSPRAGCGPAHRSPRPLVPDG
ncbi:winged helix-turn-helix domain-containing protein [Kitasatospora sp. NPDC057015]|uniref:winged helix-turn-helix domain-containing protein n=1 Tax=Kitasatospora sp. NPDC057015 TaxID=3346001 RepID=UPI003645501E